LAQIILQDLLPSMTPNVQLNAVMVKKIEDIV